MRGLVPAWVAGTARAGFVRVPSRKAASPRPRPPAPAAFDLNTACSGFCYALATADHAIRAGAARTVLVVGVERMSAVTDWTDRSTCVLVGDGAAAAVGLTASGWAGRFIEYADLRSLPERPTVAALEQKGIRVVSLDRDAFCPRRDDVVFTKGWLRPRLWGNEAVLPVKPLGPGLWESMGEKRNKKTSQD